MSRLPYHAAHRSRFPRTEMSSLRHGDTSLGVRRKEQARPAGVARSGSRAWRAPGSGCGTRPARRAATREPSHIGTFVAGPSSGGIVETTGSQRGFPSDAKPPITAFQRVDPIRAPRSAIMSAVAIPDVSGKEVVHVRRCVVQPQRQHWRRWRARALRARAAAPAAAASLPVPPCLSQDPRRSRLPEAGIHVPTDRERHEPVLRVPAHREGLVQARAARARGARRGAGKRPDQRPGRHRHHRLRHRVLLAGLRVRLLLGRHDAQAGAGATGLLHARTQRHGRLPHLYVHRAAEDVLRLARRLSHAEDGGACGEGTSAFRGVKPSLPAAERRKG